MLNQDLEDAGWLPLGEDFQRSRKAEADKQELISFEEGGNEQTELAEWRRLKAVGEHILRCNYIYLQWIGVICKAETWPQEIRILELGKGSVNQTEPRLRRWCIARLAGRFQAPGQARSNI